MLTKKDAKIFLNGRLLLLINEQMKTLLYRLLSSTNFMEIEQDFHLLCKYGINAKTRTMKRRESTSRHTILHTVLGFSYLMTNWSQCLCFEQITILVLGTVMLILDSVTVSIVAQNNLVSAYTLIASGIWGGLSVSKQDIFSEIFNFGSS